MNLKLILILYHVTDAFILLTETVGLQHYLNTSFPSMWPTLNPSWDPASFDLKKVMAEYAKEDTMPLWTVAVNPNVYNSSEYIIYVSRIMYYV